MKKIFILSVLFAMVSCSEQPDTNIYHDAKSTDDVYKVVISSSSIPIDLQVVLNINLLYTIENPQILDALHLETYKILYEELY